VTRVADFDFDLPPELIAQEPRPRGGARLLVVDRSSGRIAEHPFRDLPAILAAGDLLVANDTKVFPARLAGHRDPSGGVAEVLLLERQNHSEWEALVHPGQKLKPGARILVTREGQREPRLVITVLERRFFGRRLVRLEVESRGPAHVSTADDVDAAVDVLGHVPLPPYIHRADRPADRERYQTVFARARGSVAAPTAGLHFDDELIEASRRAGIGWATVTLHVGYGTFKPVRVDEVEEHRVDAERYEISTATAEAVATARTAGRRIVAVGTTSTRALESAATPAGMVSPGSGRTELFIHPGYTFKVVGALVTNFHLPRSSLLMLVSAFGGRELVLEAYRFAVRERFRFYSYGDAMLIV